jgi:putative ABC transport system permease protein
MFRRRKRPQRDFAEELQAHLALEADRLREAGMSEEEALAAARRKVRNITRIQERFYEAHRWLWLDDLIRDVGHGLRQLRRNPGFTAVAVITLALGIGANTAIFSVVDAVLLSPLPYPGANRMVFIWESLPTFGTMNVSWPDFLDWRKNRVFDAIAAVQPGRATLTGIGAPEVLASASVSESLFALLGAQPFLGRTFGARECKPGANTVAVVSHSFWRNFLRADPHAVGRAITLDRSTATVVGVLPSGFQFPGTHFDVYLPLGLQSNLPGMLARANHPGLEVIARLRPGVSLSRAQADMETIMARLGREYPKADRDEKAVLAPMMDQLTGSVREELILMLGSVACVLVLACASLANMSVACATVRRHEFAVRAALGATRGLLARQLLVESVILSGLGAVAGLFLASLTITPLVRLYPHPVFGLRDSHLDGRVLVFTLVVCVIATVLFGLAPALTAARADPNAWLKGGSRGGGTKNSPRLRSALVVVEIALTLVLSVGAGLLLRTLLAVANVDPGFRADHLLTMDVGRTGNAAGPQQSLSFFSEAVNRISHVPGVVSASAVMQAPLRGVHWTSPYVPSGQPGPLNTQQPWTALNMVLPGYFRTMQARLVQGRFFSDSDRGNSLPVAIINQALARRVAPHGSVVGKRIYVRYAAHPLLEVVGVVADVKQFSLTRPPMAEVYVPDAQMSVPFMTIVVRTSLKPRSVARPVVAVIHQLDKDQAVTHLTTMASIIASGTADWKFIASLLGLFAILGLVLASVGILGVASYAVAQRTVEFGIRVALGAHKVHILKIVMGQGATLALIGVGTGIVSALALTRFLSTLLYGVKPTDVLTFGAVSLMLAGVALLACYIPARRAARIDPMEALRCE